jgi:hypothetical protein
MNQTNSTTTAVEPKDDITALLESIDVIEPTEIEKLAKLDDTELLRSNIAKLVLDIAHKLGELKSIRSVSTMRELMYNLIAIETEKSIKFHKELEAKPKDTIKDISESENARLVYSAMYPKMYNKVIK